MLKKCCLAVVGLFIATIVQSQNMVVKGKITDVDTVMVLLRGVNDCDTFFTTNGSFRFDKQLNAAGLYNLVVVKNRQSINAIKEGNERKMRSKEDAFYREVFLENGELSVESSFANFPSTPMILTNRSLNDKYAEFFKRFRPLVQVARAIIDSSYAPGKQKKKSNCADHCSIGLCKLKMRSQKSS